MPVKRIKARKDDATEPDESEPGLQPTPQETPPAPQATVPNVEQVILTQRTFKDEKYTEGSTGRKRVWTWRGPQWVKTTTEKTRRVFVSETKTALPFFDEHAPCKACGHSPLNKPYEVQYETWGTTHDNTYMYSFSAPYLEVKCQRCKADWRASPLGRLP